MNDQEYYMYQAILEGRKALPHSSPNPNVGAVIVKNSKIIGRGYTQVPGKAHAEVMALKQAGSKAKNAALYVTLEPCCHSGRTAPCTDLIIQKGIKEVYIGISDPNPVVCHKGAAILKKAKIKVHKNILKDKVIQELQWYLKLYQKESPYLTLKTGMTLDGKITDYQNNSKWITSGEAREAVQMLREQNDGLIAGIRTVLKDDPALTCRRHNRKKQFFYRIILDTNLSLPLSAQVLKPFPGHITLIAAAANKNNTVKAKALQKIRGTELLFCKTKNSYLDLADLMKKLADKKNITKLIIEGGSEVNYSFLKEKLIDKLHFFIAPKLLGGQTAKGVIGNQGFKLKEAINIINGRFTGQNKNFYIYEGYLHVYRDN